MMKILDKKLSNLTIQANNVLKVGNLPGDRSVEARGEGTPLLDPVP
jgi:hypothetical protein